MEWFVLLCYLIHTFKCPDFFFSFQQIGIGHFLCAVVGDKEAPALMELQPRRRYMNQRSQLNIFIAKCYDGKISSAMIVYKRLGSFAQKGILNLKEDDLTRRKGWVTAVQAEG